MDFDMTTRAAISRSIQSARAALELAAGRSPIELARPLIRGLIARTMAEGDPAAFVRARWPAEDPNRLIKAGVAASGTDDLKLAASSSDAWFAAIGDEAVPLALPYARRVPFISRVLAPGTAGTAYWLSEAQPTPVSRLTLTAEPLDSARVSGIMVIAKETVLDPLTEDLVINDAIRAAAGVINTAFLGSQAATDGTPGGILAGVTPVTATGDLQADFGALLEDFAGDLSQSVLVMDPTTAVSIALSNSAFQHCSVTRGDVAGILQIASRDVERDSGGGTIILLDQSALSLGAESFEIVQSTNATILMSDDPENEATWVSLFQAELLAFKITVRMNWRLARTGAVAAISGTNYTAGS